MIGEAPLDQRSHQSPIGDFKLSALCQSLWFLPSFCSSCNPLRSPLFSLLSLNLQSLSIWEFRITRGNSLTLFFEAPDFCNQYHSARFYGRLCNLMTTRYKRERLLGMTNEPPLRLRWQHPISFDFCQCVCLLRGDIRRFVVFGYLHPSVLCVISSRGAIISMLSVVFVLPAIGDAVG